MTLSIKNIRASVLIVMLAALVAVTFAAQYITSFITKALGDSKAVRVSQANTCELSNDGTHFTGCSSIL